MDKRVHPRIKFKTPVDFATPSRSYQRDIINISATGMRIRTSEPIPAGAPLTLCFTLHDPVKVEGRAVWFGKEGLGVRFKAPLR